MGEMAVMGPEGDTKLIWNKESKDEVENARRTFCDLTGKGYTAYAVKKDGEKGKKIEAFDPDAEKIILVPYMVGG